MRTNSSPTEPQGDKLGFKFSQFAACSELPDWLPVRQVIRKGYEFADPTPQLAEIFVHVAGKTIRDQTGGFGVAFYHFSKGKCGIVKGVNELAHVFDPLADSGSILSEAAWRKLAFDQPFMHAFSGELAAFQGEVTNFSGILVRWE